MFFVFREFAKFFSDRAHAQLEQFLGLKPAAAGYLFHIRPNTTRRVGQLN